MSSLVARAVDGLRGSEGGEDRAARRQLLHWRRRLARRTAWFDRKVRRAHRLLRQSVPAYIRDANVLSLLTAPVIYSLIGRGRAAGARDGNGTQADDLLSLLLHAQDEDGSRMSDRQLRDEVMTLFLAGHDTTSLALSWTWHLLAQHPQAEARLHAELAEVLGNRAPTVAELPRLRYAEHVITEALRLYLDGHSYESMGEELDCDCKTIDNALQRVKRKILAHQAARAVPA